MKRLMNKNLLVGLIALVAVFAAVQVRLAEPDFLRTIQNFVFDSYQRLKPREIIDTPVVIVDIDDASLKEFGQWPWPRSRISTLVERLAQMGAAVIAFDVVFAEADRTTGSELIRQLDELKWPEREKLRPLLKNLPDNDRLLADAMDKAPVVLGYFILPEQQDGTAVNAMPPVRGKYAFGGEDPTSLLIEVNNAISPLEIFQKSARGIGMASPSPFGRDDIIRRLPMFVRDGTNIHPSLALETLRVAQDASTYIIKSTSASGEIDAGAAAITEAKIGQFQFPLTKDGEFNIYFAPEQTDRYVPAFEVINGDIEKMRARFEGQIVLVGTSAVGLEDLRKSPLGQTIPGVSIHAQVIDQILGEAFLSRPDWAKGAEILLAVLACLLLLAMLPYAGALVSATIGAVLAAAIVATSWYLFSERGILIDPVYPTMVALGIFVLTTVLRFAISERERRFVRGAFQRYLAPDLLNKLEQNPESLKLGGEIRDLTLMFMDIRGFTPISEKLSPEQLVAFLNALMSPLSDIIQKQQGAIDKYIGDSIMAFWNAPLDVEEHPQKAASAALEMLECVNQLNRDDAFSFRADGYDIDDVKIGIGLNSGEGCVGNMGSSSRFDYSVIGDTVNVAARIETACKDIGWPLLISQSTARACPDFAILKAGVVELKGKSQAAHLYALIGDEAFAGTGYFKELREMHDILISSLEKNNWKNDSADIAKKFANCRKIANKNLDEFYRRLAKNSVG